MNYPPPADATSDTPLDGYVLLGMSDGYTAQLGNLYWHAGKRAVALRIGPHRLNHLGIPHGGMLATLADTAIDYVLNRQSGSRRQSVTVHLGLDYLSSAHAGDWVETYVDVDKPGTRLSFAGYRLMSGERCLLKANATFAVVGPR